ncbi:MAG: hypothetical protein FVQ78_08570 [Solirubrobacterales bacterium]|nr:hypothetical protein [Solirubrobacterales bacterium]
MERETEDRGGKPRVVIAGGGVAGLEAMLALHDLAGERLDVRLHSPRAEFLYRPLAVTEPFGTGEVLRFDLGQLAERCGASFQLDGVVAVDGDARRVRRRDGAEAPYDHLLVASGAKALRAVPGSTVFWGVSDDGGFAEIVRRLRAGELHRVVFTMPSRSGWPFPVYELALQSAAELASAGVEGSMLTIVTPEEAPLQLFGVRASEQVRRLLAERGVELVTGAHPVKFEDGELETAPGDPIEADAVVSTPRLEGRRIEGVPHDAEGFIPIDDHGRVLGTEHVFAAGDVTAFPVKQGGIAAQQADAAAETIASLAGAEVEPRPFEPVLRGELLTGDEPRFLSGTPTGGHGDDSAMTRHALWASPGKIVGRYLAPFLASIAEIDLGVPDPGRAEPLRLDLGDG